jgi:hypothetical protein
MSRTLDQSAHTSATIAAHPDYGAAIRGVYGGLTRLPTATPVVQGIGFGLAVWTGGDLGLLARLSGSMVVDVGVMIATRRSLPSD